MATTTSHRPWETTSSPSHLQTLPSITTLTRDVDNRAAEKAPIGATLNNHVRDSAGSWTGTTSILSTPSATSGNTMPYLNSSTNHSPPHFNLTQSPSAANGLASAYSSQRNSAAPQQSTDLNQHRGSGEFGENRRTSVDSRIHQGMDSLRINGPTSPYNASTNASQSSLASSLQQQRGITTNGQRYSAGNVPISPLWPRGSRYGSGVAPRIAPPIAENPTRGDMYAAEPTRGQAWAFPDTDVPSGRPDSTLSRRDSYASSFTNSIYSNMERPLPAGQQELPGHHAHTLPHDRVSHLKGDPDSPNSTTPYSRTPELRITHKLAERKRRSEMKDCFEQLRLQLPQSASNKSSKWETLARAIEYIHSLENQNRTAAVESARMREQMQQMDLQLKELTARMNAQPGSYPPPPNTMPAFSSNHYINGVSASEESSRTLPPILNGGAMQGVQYSEAGR